VKKESFRLLLGLFLLILATLACESDATFTAIEAAPTLTPTSEPTPENIDPNYVLSLPVEVKSSSGWTFTVHRVELLSSLDTSDRRYSPTRGLYLWLAGVIGNFTNERDCIRGQEFTLRSGSERIKMLVQDAEAAHKILNLSYPDCFLGHCLDVHQTMESFLIFDVPREAGDLWLELDDGKVQLGRMSALIQAMPRPQSSLDAEAQTKPHPLVTANQTNVNIRNGPGIQYAIIGKLLLGQSFEISGRNADSSWWQISTPNGLGWVAAKFTTTSNVDDRIPIVELPR
jgi:hypothetical protein